MNQKVKRKILKRLRSQRSDRNRRKVKKVSKMQLLKQQRLLKCQKQILYHPNIRWTMK
ncbi:hypothetical protein T06_2956 [Trichinella sp. T6]|nr:hypothetical protein T06_2956 [Trichinella sp. T6]